MVLTLSTFAVTIETDRTWYLAGEAMRVSVRANNAVVAYAELCDTQGLAAGTLINLKSGEGNGVIELPSDLHSGYYLLSAYTRNDTLVSQQLVAVINPLRKSAADDIEWLSADSCWADPGDWSNHKLQSSKLKFQSSETEGHIVQARIKNVYNGRTFKSSQICPALSIIGKQIHYFEGKMVNDSTAYFHTFGIYGKQPIVISAVASSMTDGTSDIGNGVSLPIEVISPFATLLPKQLPHLKFHYNRSEVEARSLDMQRHQKALAIAPDTPSDYDESVYGTKPDLTYNLDEYRQFFTIREVLIEYVNCVSHRKSNGVSQLLVRRAQDPYNTFMPTLVLIDGMPVYDVERLLNYDARRIHYINIYGSQYLFGNEIYNGILSFVTRSGRLTNYPTERNMQYLEYEFPK